MRTGALPPRGSGVTVFVTKASSDRATSGAVSASRQPEAFRARGRLYRYGTTVKAVALVVVPPAVVTLIFPVVAPRGTMAVICVDESRV